jgi:hypothetical protein
MTFISGIPLYRGRQLIPFTCRAVNRDFRDPAKADIKRQREEYVVTSEDDENAELFSAVLSTLDREQLPLLANAILRRQPCWAILVCRAGRAS